MLIQPACGSITDPIDRVFALLARYRELLQATECSYGCPIGDLALEIHEPDPPVRALLAANFERWTTFVQQCFDSARDRLPPRTNTRELAQFVLTTMEGGVMLARTYRDLAPFDAAVSQLKSYLALLQSSRLKPTRNKKRL